MSPGTSRAISVMYIFSTIGKAFLYKAAPPEMKMSFGGNVFLQKSRAASKESKVKQFSKSYFFVLEVVFAIFDRFLQKFFFP